MGLLIKLQDGDTAFKSLKFGNDRPGGGDSGQPYIKTPIERINSPVNKDFLLRGGINTPLDAAEDVARLTKYFFDFRNPSGLLFTAKQNLLSRTGTKTEASKGIGYAGGLINEGIYTPLSTIAEAGVIAFGGHLNKQGLDPTGLISSLGIKKYQDIISKQSTENFKENNRLVKLTNNIIENKSSGFNFLPGYYLNKGESLISYRGGAGSTLGIGTTNIRFSTDNTNTPIKTLIPKPKEYLVGKKEETIDRNKFISPIKASEAYLYLSPNGEKDFENLPNNLTIDGRNSYEYDFYPSVYLDNTTGSLTPKTDLKSYLTKSPRLPETNLFTLPINASSKYNELQTQTSGSDKVQFKDLIQYDLTSDGKNSYQESHNNNVYQPGTLTAITDIGTYNTLTQNKINALSSTRGTPVYTAPASRTKEKIPNIEILYNSNQPDSIDLISFRIEIINPQNPSDIYSMNFRSFIDNFSDSYTAEWDAQKYMGRAESFYKYNGFGREINIGFTVAVQSKAEMTTTYNKLNYLASSLAPTYTEQGYMAGNLSKITVGTYIYEQYGIIKSLSYDISDESPWEIISDELPMIIKATMTFTPIHNFRPEVGKKFIAQK
jgi:hypothetical protein